MTVTTALRASWQPWASECSFPLLNYLARFDPAEGNVIQIVANRTQRREIAEETRSRCRAAS
jgi:hypothetical protein